MEMIFMEMLTPFKVISPTVVGPVAIVAAPPSKFVLRVGFGDVGFGDVGFGDVGLVHVNFTFKLRTSHHGRSAVIVDHAISIISPSKAVIVVHVCSGVGASRDLLG